MAAVWIKKFVRLLCRMKELHTTQAVQTSAITCDQLLTLLKLGRRNRRLDCLLNYIVLPGVAVPALLGLSIFAVQN
jgi:hypothetical protein